MITQEKKKEIVAELVEDLKGANALYLVDFTGMTVADAIRLRRAFKEVGVKYRVAKNSLIKRALERAEVFDKIPEEKFAGPSGMAITYDDPTAPAKVIKKEYDKEKKPVLKCAQIETEYFDGERLKELASMPGKLDLMASIVGSLDAPISGIVGAINALTRDLASVIEEVAKKKAS